MSTLNTPRPALRAAVRAGLTASVAGFALPAVLLAQTTDGSDARDPVRLEEIVVTASKRGQSSVQVTPISIRALTGEGLVAQGVTEFEDWARFVPGVTFRDLGPGEKTIITRGLVSTGAATTAVYFDEVVTTAFNDGEGGGRNVDFKLHDIERIEVLRGPQGTLYGGSALGGLVRILPRQPDASGFASEVELGVGSTENGGENYRVNGYVNLPLIDDRLAVRLVGWYEDNSGYIDQIRFGLEDINEEETTGGRVALRYEVNDRLTLSGLAMYQDQQTDGGSRFNPEGTVAQQFPDYTGPALVVDDDLQNTDFTQNSRSDEASVFSLKAEMDLGVGQVVAVANLYSREFLNNFDSTPILLFFGVPIAALSSFPEDRSIQSNEIRFSSDFDGRFQMVTGLLYQKEEIDSESNVLSVDENGIVSVPSPDILSVLREREFDEQAIFGEFTWAFTEQLSATVGGRYAEFDFVTDENAVVPFFGPPTGPEPTKRGDEDATTFKFNLAYTLNDDAMVYATASEGYRRGGLNLNAFGDLFDIPETFSSDELWNYEIGTKTSWLDDRLVVNATIYTLQWEDIQVETADETGSIEYFTNAGTAQVDGVEFELFSRPLPGWDLTAVIGYTDARLTEDQPERSAGPDDPTLGRDGDRLNNVPEWTFAVSSAYTWSWFGDFDGLIRGDYSYTGSSETQISPRSPSNVELDSYDLLNLQLGISNRNWKAILFVDNAFDERPQNDAINDTTNILAYVTSRPRTIGVRLGYQF